MKKIISVSLVLLFLSFSSVSVFGQTKDALYFFKDSPHSTGLNPASVPDNKFHFYLGFGLSDFRFNTSGFTYHDIINRHPVYADSLRFDIKGLAEKLKDNNDLNFSYDIDLLGFGFGIGRNYFSYRMYMNMSSRFSFSKGLFDFVLYGTETPEKKLALMDGKLMDVNGYIAHSVSYGREINDKLKVGASIKYLNGLINVKTEKADMGLDYSNEDRITANGSVDILTSNVFGSISISSLFDSNSNYSFTSESFADIVSNAVDNKGLAFDLGASYKLNDKMELSVSILDLGFINWKSNNTRIRNKNSSNTVTFGGIETSIDSIGTGLETHFNNFMDSLSTALDLESVTQGSYTAALPTEFHFGYSWNFHSFNHFHALLSTKLWNSRFVDTRLSVLYALHTKYVSLSIGNTFSSNAWFNPSALLNLKFGANVYLGCSFNSSSTSFNIADMSGFNLVTGISFAFGTNKQKKKENIE